MLKKTLDAQLVEYKDTVEDTNELVHFKEISEISNISIQSLLSELTVNNPNEVILYKLKRDLINVFEKSEHLRSLRNINLL